MLCLIARRLQACRSWRCHIDRASSDNGLARGSMNLVVTFWRKSSCSRLLYVAAAARRELTTLNTQPFSMDHPTVKPRYVMPMWQFLGQGLLAWGWRFGSSQSATMTLCYSNE